MSFQLAASSFQTAAAALLLAIGLGGCRDASGGAPKVDVTMATVAAAGASNPSVAITHDDETLVAWVGGEEAEDVWLARASSTGFAEPVRVNDVAGDAAAHGQAPAQVAVGPDGAVYVMWQNNEHIEGRRFPASDLRFARSSDGGRTFEPAIHVNDDADGEPASHTFHDLVVAHDGTIYASWIDGRGHAHGADGHAAGGPDIRVARSTDGGRTFGPGTIVVSGACPCCRTNLAVGPDGAVYVAWRHVFEGSVRDIVVARSSDGGTAFGEPVRVHEDGWVFDGCPHAGPSIAVDGAGALHVVWFTGTQRRPGVFHATSRDGGRTFGEPRALATGEFVPTSQVSLAPAADGVWIAYEENAGDGPRIRVAHAGASGAAHVTQLDAPAGMLPSLAARGDALAVAWLDGESVRAMLGSAGVE
ncbi:MAG TPA: sialidase family protein [Longimicrobiales bacterium]